jgi:hypothetical protein
MDYVPLNIELMRHPANWVILFLMIAIVGLAISLCFPATAPAET